MSSIVTFFVASDNTVAAGVADSGPDVTFRSATFGNFDVVSTLEEWESLLTERDLEELIAAGGPDVLSGTDGPLVLMVPADLTKALANADSEALATTAVRWIELRAEEGEVIDDELADELLSDVAALSAEAERATSSLYCWIC